MQQKLNVDPQSAGPMAPRPLPLFLELVRRLSTDRPKLAAKALDGLARYQNAPRPSAGANRPTVARIGARIGASSLRDCGGSGPIALLVPSLINPPDILDLDEETSLALAIGRAGRRSLLLDWGDSRERGDLDLGAHVEQLLCPLIRQLSEPPALIGYCLGGTMAIAAANLTDVECVVTLAAPWRFSAYPEGPLTSLEHLWANSKGTAETLGALPMEVLQSAFWSLDPERIVTKFARFADLADDSPAARRFVALEDWANRGEPLPFPAARELIVDLFGHDLPGRGEWRLGDRLLSDRPSCPTFNVAASNDRITPEAATPAGDTITIESGHVGMIVGSARTRLHSELSKFLASSCR